jgi:hypothetical protein
MIFVADLHTDVNTQKGMETHMSLLKVYYCNIHTHYQVTDDLFLGIVSLLKIMTAESQAIAFQTRFDVTKTFWCYIYFEKTNN